MRVFFVATSLVLSASFGWAQEPASAPVDPTKVQYMSAADVTKGVAAAAAKQGTTPSAVVRVFQLPPYTVNIEHRISVPQNPATHDTEAELFYIIDGSATMVTGGKITGKTIEGGATQVLGKGDFLMVPAGVPHWFSKVDGAFTQMSFHLPMPPK